MLKTDTMGIIARSCLLILVAGVSRCFSATTSTASVPTTAATSSNDESTPRLVTSTLPISPTPGHIPSSSPSPSNSLSGAPSDEPAPVSTISNSINYETTVPPSPFTAEDATTHTPSINSSKSSHKVMSSPSPCFNDTCATSPRNATGENEPEKPSSTSGTPGSLANSTGSSQVKLSTPESDTTSDKQETTSSSGPPANDVTTSVVSPSPQSKDGQFSDRVADQHGRHVHSEPVSKDQFAVFGVVMGLFGAILIVCIAFVIHRLLKNPKKNIFLNWEAKRLDVFALRRYAINDVRASFGGIPAVDDIWHDMKTDSNVVV